MENHKEIMKSYITRSLLFLSSLGLPACIHAADMPESSVGTPVGAVSVGNSGAAVYNLKIDVPDGGSLAPQIGLSYNSQSGGYGLAGYGFNITGLSAITRGGHDLFHDGSQAGVTYTANDNLFLDGKRLILQSGTSCQEGAAYTVEGDPFTKIVVHGNYSNSTTTTWFEVTTNTGMTYQYGNSPSSKITYKNKSGYSRIASWYVNKATDKYSNYITYDYSIGNFFIRPVGITYGTNSAKNRGIVNKVNFFYQNLGNNARPFAVEDQQGLIDMCLSSITTTCNNSIYRTYTFSYNNSDQSTGKWTRLVTVEEANRKGDKYPPVKFTWQYLPFSSIYSSQLAVSTKDGSSFVEETDKQFLSADLNGDGISDIIRVSPVKVTTAVWAGGFINNAGNSWLDGHSFGKGLLAGLGSGGLGILEGGIVGGLIGGLDALDKGTNFWTGKTNIDITGAYACSNCNSSGFNLNEKTVTRKYVGEFEGVNVFETKKLGSLVTPESDGYYHYRAVTVPERGIIAGEGVFTSGQRAGQAMMQHEFGHILQYRMFGPAAYWHVIAPESFANATFFSSSHHKYWTETWANYLAKGHSRGLWIGGVDYPIKNISTFNWWKMVLAQMQGMMMAKPRGCI